MTSAEIRTRFLEFYKKQGHTILPSASIVPENDPTTLFTGSGMQPLVPYLLGQKHPEGKKLVNVQKAFRSADIEEVGDNRHTTFFEMLGNWSLGSYFKEEQLPWVFEFLTKEIDLNPEKLFVSVFIGDENIGLPKDTDSAELWQKLFKKKGIEAKIVEIGSQENGYFKGMQDGRIFYYDAKKNWWSRSGAPEDMPAGEPGGPDSEIFYEFDYIPHDQKFGPYCHPNCDCGRFMEIGNSVFMEYKKEADGSFKKLPQQNVDFGGGLERVAAASLDAADMFKIDTLKGIIVELERLSGKSYDELATKPAFQVVADHLRAATFLIGDGVTPSNTERGYFVRRLLRRAIRYWDTLEIKDAGLWALVDTVLEFYKEDYPETYSKKEIIKKEIATEEEKFRRTLKEGLKQLEKRITYLRSLVPEAHTVMLQGEDVFNLLQTYGFPLELTLEIAEEKGITIDVEGFKREMEKHQDLSRVGSEKKFKGGLGDTSEMSIKYHTTTHLLNAALKQVLGNHVSQRGSNITPERLRFDFSHPEKLTDEQKKQVEDLINDWIKQDLSMTSAEMPKIEAEKIAVHSFLEKYGDTVKVYSVGTEGNYISREFCGGPHVERTGVLGTFKIQKEEAISTGIRRIKAVLE
ncbi:alanine--tRNA ligase [Candidatus Parcubacteria bacterium]|nr:alanine--tRNA ligase [Candidatus Parcubacteria bacterium]